MPWSRPFSEGGYLGNCTSIMAPSFAPSTWRMSLLLWVLPSSTPVPTNPRDVERSRGSSELSEVSFLSGFKGKTLSELNEALDLWRQDLYHQRKHTSTGKTPFDRFTAQMQCLRPAPKDLQNYFRKHTKRRVAKDRTIVLNGKLYEAPIPLIGKQVLCLYHDERPQKVEVVHEHRSYGFLTPLDLHINCRVRRNKASGTDVEPSEQGSRY